jgi:SAM-dependent methyltransferase
MNGELFGENYYMNGIESGVSNYVNYRWLPELTLPMAKSFIEIFGIKKGATVLDWGCAFGFFVKALREHRVKAFGVDISEWAIKNCDTDVIGYVFNKLEDCPSSFDYIFSKDVLEHIPMEELTKTLEKLFNICTEAAVFIVPLARSEGGEYVYPADELDKTHIHRKTIDGWIDLIQPLAKDFTIFTSNRIPILKKANEQYTGCAGIIYCKKLKNKYEYSDGL